MNTQAVRKMLQDKDANGEYKIPFLIVCDAFQSETVAFADLVLPDTTYLERHDAMSMLDRPISEFEGPVDSVRVPVLPPKDQCKPFQEVLIELAGRLNLPGFVTPDGQRKYKDYPDFIINYETAPGSGIGFLAGWRGADGQQAMKGAPNPAQWQKYAENNCVFQHHLPQSKQYMRNWNKDYLAWAKENQLIHNCEPILIHLYSDVLQKFRLAAQGKRAGRQPPARLRQRIEAYFDPLPFYYPALEAQQTDLARYPLSAVTQRPMAMYHSWGSMNAWLRQIHTRNRLQVPGAICDAHDLKTGDWAWVISHHGRIKVEVERTEAVNPLTMWTWNAIGKRKGSWGLDKDAPEAERGFLLNHLIHELLPPKGDGRRWSNSDPVTGQAAWYDLRVRIEKAEAGAHSEPQFAPVGKQGKASPAELRYGQEWSR